MSWWSSIYSLSSRRLRSSSHSHRRSHKSCLYKCIKRYFEHLLHIEWFVRYSELVHIMKLLPSLGLDVEKIDLAISVSIFATNQNDFVGRYWQSTASPEGILHSDGEDGPNILLNFIDFNAIINLLLSAAKEASECVNELVVDCACREIMSLIFHGSHRSPLIFLNGISFHRVQSLLAWKATKNEYCSFAKSDCMSVSTLVHHSFWNDVVLLSMIKPRVLLWGRTSSSDKNFQGR